MVDQSSFSAFHKLKIRKGALLSHKLGIGSVLADFASRFIAGAFKIAVSRKEENTELSSIIFSLLF